MDYPLGLKMLRELRSRKLDDKFTVVNRFDLHIARHTQIEKQIGNWSMRMTFV